MYLRYHKISKYLQNSISAYIYITRPKQNPWPETGEQDSGLEETGEQGETELQGTGEQEETELEAEQQESELTELEKLMGEQRLTEILQS